MIKFAEHLNESLDSSYKFVKQDWKKSRGIAVFHDDDDNIFHCTFDRYNSEEIEVIFSQRTGGKVNMEPTGNIKNALKVYSTIGKALQEYIADFPVSGIYFSAMNDRIFLVYQRLAKVIARRLNGTVSMGNDKDFVITLD